ncbi:legume-specific protein [Senna tora]|uniref:Legume-specific protein n=1 Tax=Senna tora TaxID=362788 RepID=A0A834TSE1_9FABA|nr:legume-specific protein [Senna tora]
MEGLIPFVYRAIVHYKNDKEGPIGSWLSESPSYSYMRLPGDSGRFQPSASALFSSASSPTSMANASSATTQVMVASSGVQSPRRRLAPRRVSTGQAVMNCIQRLIGINLVVYSSSVAEE